MLLSVDDLVDNVMNTLESTGEDETTLSFFLSDNGSTWFEHGLTGAWKSKRTPYTDSVRIPLFVRGPGFVAARRVDDRLAATIDVVPTVLDVTGVRPGAVAPLDGRSLLRDDERTRLLLEHWEEPPRPIPEWASLLTSSYQYVEYYEDGSDEPSFVEYYDLERDPWQLHNLLANASQHDDPDVSAVAARLDSARRCVGVACP
jgi:arylsulfatase A-like enzyme